MINLKKIEIPLLLIILVFFNFFIPLFNIDFNEKESNVRIQKVNIKKEIKMADYHHVGDVIIDDQDLFGVPESITWAEAADEDWCNGTGTLNDPYIIENVQFNAQTSPFGIALAITPSILNCHFIIRFFALIR